MPEGPEKEAAEERTRKGLATAGHAHRLRIGMDEDGSVAIRLNDTKGQARIRIAVDREDCAGIEFLDTEGNVVYSLPPNPSGV